MKITVEGNVFEGTPEEIKEMMTLLGAELPESAKEVKPTPKFKVGYRARLKTDRGALAGFTAGEIVEITKVGRDSYNDVVVRGKSHGTIGYTTSENLEELTYEFSEGDRVKALADGEYGYVKEGDFGTVVDILNDEDDPHFIEVKTSDDYDYFRPQDLELIADETAKLEDGDYVVALPGAPYYITSSDMKLGKIVGNGVLAGDDITVKVIAHDDAFRVGNEYSVESKYFRKATDEEIAKFTKKPREFKKGDIVRVMDSPGALPEGTIFEVESIDKYGYVYDDSPKNYVYMLPQEQLELIAPVESRVDVE